VLEQLSSVSLENTILSSLISFPEQFADIEPLLMQEAFYTESNRDVYAMMMALERLQKPIEASLIASSLKKTGKNESSVTVLLATMPTPNITDLVYELVEMRNKRNLYLLSIKIQEGLQSKESSHVISMIEQEVEKVSFTSDDGIMTFDELKERFLNEPPRPIYDLGVSFVNEALRNKNVLTNEVTHGIKMGQLILLMGDPEAGKTMLALQILAYISQSRPVLFFCFEFTTRAFVETELMKHKMGYQNPNMHVVDTGYDIIDIEYKVKKMHRKGCRFVLIDSQMRVTNDSNSGTVEQVESDKFSRLAKLCHRLDITIIYICQQGKDDSKSAVIQPMGSKKGAHEASIIWYLKTQKDKEGNMLLTRTFIQSKNKQNGVHFAKEVNFNPLELKFVRQYGKQEREDAAAAGFTPEPYEAPYIEHEEIPFGSDEIGPYEASLI